MDGEEHWIKCSGEQPNCQNSTGRPVYLTLDTGNVVYLMPQAKMNFNKFTSEVLTSLVRRGVNKEQRWIKPHCRLTAGTQCAAIGLLSYPVCRSRRRFNLMQHHLGVCIKILGKRPIRSDVDSPPVMLSMAVEI